MQYVERKIGEFLHERRINDNLNKIEPFAYPNVSKGNQWYSREHFRRIYRGVAILYSNGDPQVGLLTIECFKDIFMDLVGKGLITQTRKFFPVELLKPYPNPNDTLGNRPKLKRLLDEMMIIKRSGRSFEVTDSSTHSRTFSSYHDNPFDYTDYDVEHEDLSPDVIEIGKTHVHERKDVTPDEVKYYNPGSGYDEGYTPSYEHTHQIVGIWGRIVPKNQS